MWLTLREGFDAAVGLAFLFGITGAVPTFLMRQVIALFQVTHPAGPIG